MRNSSLISDQNFPRTRKSSYLAYQEKGYAVFLEMTDGMFSVISDKKEKESHFFFFYFCD